MEPIEVPAGLRRTVQTGRSMGRNRTPEGRGGSVQLIAEFDRKIKSAFLRSMTFSSDLTEPQTLYKTPVSAEP
jgi:hypothetical protein